MSESSFILAYETEMCHIKTNNTSLISIEINLNAFAGQTQ
jgi:hypothetical protein